MNIPVQNCSSCGACANVCARDAITMRLDQEGFFRPEIDSTRCIKCGACEKTCPWTHDVLNPHGSTNNPETIAAYAKDESIRMQSSSGGIFTVLAEKVLNDGGVAVGVAQVAPTQFEHVVVDAKEDLTKLRGSKYVQANTRLVYNDVRALLKAGRKVLFSGTPCQVAGLYAVLGKFAETTNLTTVDVVCHGTPSIKVFEKYISELERDRGASVLFSRFRDKRKGWKRFSMTSFFDNNALFSRTLHRDKFMRVFLDNICLNRSCGDCRYGKIPRIADISLGDFWGVSNHHPEMDDDKGTSIVFLNTINGKKIFSSVSDEVIQCESKIEYAVSANPCIVRSVNPHPKRSEFLKRLNSESFNMLVDEYFPPKSSFSTFFDSVIDLLKAIKFKLSHF